jgi:hypothetical protein
MIQETKCPHHLLQTLASRIWPSSLTITLDAQGSAGGLALLWNPSEIYLSDFFSTKYSLSTHFQLTGSSLSGTLTNVYGPNLLLTNYTFLPLLSSSLPLSLTTIGLLGETSTPSPPSWRNREASDG